MAGEVKIRCRVKHSQSGKLICEDEIGNTYYQYDTGWFVVTGLKIWDQPLNELPNPLQWPEK